MISINNLLGLNAYNELTKKQKKTTASLEKLSSGLRINKAADDAAGLAISEKMRALVRGLSQAARNIHDGISYIDTADGYLGSIQAPPLQRLRELAIQAANDTLSHNDRNAIQEEVEAIQEHLTELFSNAEFNTIKIFAQDIKRTKTPIPGVLPGDTVIRQYGLQVVTGKNDHLTFRLDGEPFEITLNSGNYTADQLVQALNTEFQAAGTDITVDFEGDSLVYKSPTKLLDSFGGSMISIDAPLAYTSIIYDNSKPGFISGSSIVGEQDISAGVLIDSSHDILAFRVGSNGTYTNVSIQLAAGNYSSADLITTLNNYFDSNHISVTASVNSANKLMLQHDTCGAGYTLDQLSGSARSVVLDRVVTTVLQESRVSGSNGNVATFTGYKQLTSGVTITAGQNDAFRFQVDGVTYNLNLTAGNYTKEQILGQLNTLFSANSINLNAQLDGLNRLQLIHTGSGTHTIGGIAGGAAYQLFGSSGFLPSVSPGTYYFVEGNSTPLPGNRATVTGNTNLSNGVQIVTGYNDTLAFELDGVLQSITLSSGWYSSASLLSEINGNLAGLNVTAAYNGSNALVFSHKFAGGGIPLYPYSLNNFSGNALNTLMGTLIPTNTVSGTSPTASYIVGYANVTNVNIASGFNDTLTITVNGAAHDITIAAGSYNQSQLVTQINTALNLEGIGADIVANPYGSYLELRSRTAGTATQLNSVSGNAVNTLFRSATSYTLYADLNPPNQTDTYIDGRMNLRNGVIIASGKNDKLTFDLHDSGSVERKTITLAAGEYTADTLAAMVNQCLTDEGIAVKAVAKDITTSKGAETVLNLTYSPGKNGYYTIDGIGGSAAYTVFYPGPYKTDYSGGVGLSFQVGASSGNSLSSGTQFLLDLEILGVDDLDLTSQAGASRAIDAVDNAVDLVDHARGLAGAKRNALESLYRNVTQSEENLAAAQSRIREADIAKEMLEYAKQSILSQASTAMLAQANQQPQMILQLLQPN